MWAPKNAFHFVLLTAFAAIIGSYAIEGFKHHVVPRFKAVPSPDDF